MSRLPRIPGYRLEREVGSGGMAVVYEAVQEKLNRRVAVKVLSPNLSRDQKLTARFLKEAETAATLHHSHIVAVHDVGRREDTHFIVMEFLEGNLKERLAHGPLHPAEALHVLRQVASALGYAHRRGFVHRDIKPENIMFRHDGTAVLADFGIARAVRESARLTDEGVSLGTPYYMSPEQCRDEAPDGRSDLYSLGVVLFEMLSGGVPHAASNTVAVVLKHLQDPVPLLPAHLGRYQPLVEKMMAKDREKRIQSAEELIGLIDRLQAETVETSPDVTSRVAIERGPEKIPVLPTTPAVAGQEKKGRPVPAAVIPLVILLTAAVGGLVFVVLRDRPRGAPLRPETQAGSVTRVSGVPEKSSGGPSEPQARNARVMPLRSSAKTLSVVEAGRMLRQLGLFASCLDQADPTCNPGGDFGNDLDLLERPGAPVVMDRAAGLVWHSAGSPMAMEFDEVGSWLAALNAEGYAGYSGWRLPTLEEAASLLEPMMAANDRLYIHPIFSPVQKWIWTADAVSGPPGGRWIVDFTSGRVSPNPHDFFYVRPVRSSPPMSKRLKDHDIRRGWDFFFNASLMFGLNRICLGGGLDFYRALHQNRAIQT